MLMAVERKRVLRTVEPTGNDECSGGMKRVRALRYHTCTVRSDQFKTLG